MSKNIKNKEAEATSVVDSVKISELQETLFLNENDVIPVVQNGETKKFKTKVLHGLKTRVVDNTTTGGKEYAWSAEQGKLIHNRVAKIETLTPVWQDHNGTNGSLTINDGFEETIKDLVVRGKTLGGYNAETGQSDNIMSSGESEGNKIVVKSIGKNLFDIKSLIQKSVKPFGNGIEIVDKQQVSVDVNIQGKWFLSCNHISDNVVNASGGLIEILQMDDTKSYVIHNTTRLSGTKGIKRITTLNYCEGTHKFTDFQIEQGTLATEYEPYKFDKKEILLPFEGGLKGDEKIGYDIANEDKIIQKNIKYTFTGNENVVLDKFVTPKDTQITFMINFPLINTNPTIPYMNIIANKYKTTRDCIANVNIEGISTFVKDIRISVLKSKLDTPDIEGFKKLLKNWYDSNSPLEIIYDLENPIIHNIEKLTLPQYAGTTHLIIENEVAGDIICKAKVSLSAQGKRLREENQKLKIENEKLKDDLIAKSEYFHSNDMTLTHSDLELDFRMLEIEFALDIPININMKGKVKDMAARTPYEMIKVLILGGSYDRADFEYKISVYVKRGRMTQAEADELIALMDADELQNK